MKHGTYVSQSCMSQHNLYFNQKEFVKCLVHGIYSSFVLFFVPMGTIYNSVCSDGKEISNNQYFSLIVQTSLLWVVTTQVWCGGRGKRIEWGACLKERKGRWEGSILHYGVGEGGWLSNPCS